MTGQGTRGQCGGTWGWFVSLSTAAIADLLESPDPGVAAAERARPAGAIPRRRHHFGAIDREIGCTYGGERPRHPRSHGVAGVRPPHRRISRSGRTVSTLDLTARGFTLIGAPAGQHWPEALGRIAGAPPCPPLLMGRGGVAPAFGGGQVRRAVDDFGAGGIAVEATAVRPPVGPAILRTMYRV